MPPVNPLPYGEAPAYCFPLAEVCMYVLFVLCLLYAVKQNIRHVSYLLAGVLFGLLLEYVNVVSKMGYIYGKFFVMLGKPPFDIPLCIGLGWGVIMYTARLFTDSLKLPLWTSVCLDALLALSVDLSMDVVAYRLHMWTWDWRASGRNPLTAAWFGVPYGNFLGWLYVVFFYSSISRLLERWLTKNNKLIKLKLAVIPLLSVIASQVALYVTLVYVSDFMHRHSITDGIRLAFTLVVLALVVLYGWRKKQRFGSPPLPFITWLVPIWFHVYFFTWLFIGGFYKETPWLVIAGVLNLVIGVAIHFRTITFKKTMQVKPA
jgi:uncharacterized membrane protein